jgi:hypothetical protein
LTNPNNMVRSSLNNTHKLLKKNISKKLNKIKINLQINIHNNIIEKKVNIKKII